MLETLSEYGILLFIAIIFIISVVSKFLNKPQNVTDQSRDNATTKIEGITSGEFENAKNNYKWLSILFFWIGAPILIIGLLMFLGSFGCGNDGFCKGWRQIIAFSFTPIGLILVFFGFKLSD